MDSDASLGIALVRLVVGALLLGHSWQKLFGWFHGAGLAGTGAMFDRWGLRPGRVFALAAGLAESAGAALLIAGAVTPLAAAIISGAMIVAIGFNARRGLWAHLGGYEVALTYGVIAVAVATCGPGEYSVDHMLGLGEWRGPVAALGALGLGMIGASGPLLLRFDTVRRSPVAGDGTDRRSA